MRNKIGQRNQCGQRANTDPNHQSQAAADEREHRRFGKKLTQNIAPGGAHRLANTDLPGTLRYRNQHDIHDADSAQAQSDDGHAAEKQGDEIKDTRQYFRAVHGVPYEQGIFVRSLEMMHAAERSPHLQYRIIVRFRIAYLEHDVIEVAPHNPFFLRGREVSRDR